MLPVFKKAKLICFYKITSSIVDSTFSSITLLSLIVWCNWVIFKAKLGFKYKTSAWLTETGWCNEDQLSETKVYLFLLQPAVTIVYFYIFN